MGTKTLLCAFLLAALLLSGCSMNKEEVSPTPELSAKYEQALDRLLSSQVEKVTCLAYGNTYTLTDSKAIAQLMNLISPIEFVCTAATHAPGSGAVQISFVLSDGTGAYMTLPESNLEFDGDDKETVNYCEVQVSGEAFDTDKVLSLFYEQGEVND